MVIEVAILYSDEFSALVEEGRLEPMDALAVRPRCEAAPSYYAWVESSLFEEKPFRFIAQPRMFKMACVACCVEGLGWHVGRRRLRFVLFYYYVCGVCQPSASIGKVLAQTIHHEVDSATVCVASEAAVGVGTNVECQTGVMVVVERTEALVTRDAESEAFSNCLNGQLTELLYGFLIHDVK